MPLYMDIHSVPGVKSKDVAEAHRKDLIYQHEYGCNCMTYWIDEARETIFCLIEAGDRDAVKEMHRKAHGLVPHKIIEVSSSVVQSFLGRIYDPEDALTENGLKVFADPGFRVILVTRTMDPVLLRHRLGAETAEVLLQKLNETVRTHIRHHNGSEAEHPGTGFVVSFESATQAVACALAVRNQFPSGDAKAMDLRMALHGGEPVENSNTLFGDAIQAGLNLCTLADPGRVALSAQVKDLAAKELVQNNKSLVIALSQADEDVMQLLYEKLESHFHNPDFDIPEYAQAMAMSQTQLYRKTTALTGMSCNNLLKDFRLEKALALMKKGRHSIAQVTFDTGFSNPSYFTKCFKSRYNMLPTEYLSLHRSA